MNNKQVAVFYGDDASPEVMQPYRRPVALNEFGHRLH